ncbi:hypothetical protein JCM9140_3152 [Halalkalibacter wakoensis JCM 9140]|uniref:Uncharacterized protein n=1 Tax=Halalkalibacter wakoensis JCM 9140 TaxID=1236970 RepID=W4Q519_9BACI|nr:hypothetical protein [Halalkalibacter wakoensis]GAE27040.1 hypothetical protein JCM9140_3152 [Halalkalibacter wakoensis JCM 9140]
MLVKITCHDNEAYEINVDDYDPESINEQINNQEIITVKIGNMIFSRIDIKRVVPIESAQ